MRVGLAPRRDVQICDRRGIAWYGFSSRESHLLMVADRDADLAGVATHLDYRPRGIHRPDPA
ncbi:MAG: hypothetical protein ACOH19_16980 [Rhodoglobus sp.]